MQSVESVCVRALGTKCVQHNSINCGRILMTFSHSATRSSTDADKPNVAGWVAGCLSVTRWYCSSLLNTDRRSVLQTAKPILKHFRPSGGTITLVSSDPCDHTQFQGEPFSAGDKYTGVQGGKNWRRSCDFRRKSPFISETVRHMPIVTM